MLRTSLFVMAFSASVAAAAVAAPNEDHWGTPPSVDYARATELVASADFKTALPLLESLAEKSPGDADVFNLLGFSHRKTGNLDRAASAYARALRLNPDHRGALAYQGELFLSQGEIAAAEGNLARLAALCPSACEERSDLAKAVAAWKDARG